MVSEVFDPSPIEKDESGRVYSLQSGSGGFKASSEKVAVDRLEDGTYEIVFISPAGSSVVAENIEDGEEAIRRGRKRGEGINVGMPGSGKIDVPDFDYSKVPPEP